MIMERKSSNKQAMVSAFRIVVIGMVGQFPQSNNRQGSNRIGLFPPRQDSPKADVARMGY